MKKLTLKVRRLPVYADTTDASNGPAERESVKELSLLKKMEDGDWFVKWDGRYGRLNMMPNGYFVLRSSDNKRPVKYDGTL